MLTELTESAQETELQVERILRSETFRNAEALKRLLRFLADRLALGEDHQLKEYSVGIDALGKPEDYDPRRDSTVRIQVGRLRLKLAEYYMTEGLKDPQIIELPKGRFKLKVTSRPPVAETAAELAPPAPDYRRAFLMLAGVTVIAIAWAAMATYRLTQGGSETSLFQPAWTPALERLWAPFIRSGRPLVLAMEDPPFVQFEGFGVYRELSFNSWQDIEKSDTVAKMRALLGNPPMKVNHYYAPAGEVNAAFLLGRFLGLRAPSVSLAAMRELSWQQMASNNVLYVGASGFFHDRLQELPVALDLDHERDGVVNLRPRPGELKYYPEEGFGDVSISGERYALITHLPGLSGTGDVISITSQRTMGRFGAVQWFIDPTHAAELVAKMTKPDGTFPQYYQVLLKVKYKDGVPVESNYVLHHELQRAHPK